MTDTLASTASVPPVFASLGAQPTAVSLLSRSLEANRVSHAYLFVGAPGALIVETAEAFAASLVCATGGCGTCEACKQVQRGAHPDVSLIAPQGARAYLVDQIRDVVVQAQYAPVSGPRRVFILDKADQMNQASANAFLKTLEEPAEGVVFILIAASEQAVLPTILSRCQVIRFRTIPVDEGALLVQERTGVSAERAALAVAATEGSITDAVKFAADTGSWELRNRVFTALNSLGTQDSWGALTAAKTFGEAWLAPAEELKEAQKKLRERNAEFLDAKSLKEYDQKDKRAVTAATAAGFARITALIRCWLADVLLAREGMGERMVNTDMADDICRAAALVQERGIREAVEACSCAERLIAYNVSPQNALDALMLELRAVLFV